MGELPPAGFYPDPEQPARLRWWDGARWTHHFAAEAPPASLDQRDPRKLAWFTVLLPALVPVLAILAGAHGAGGYSATLYVEGPTMLAFCLVDAFRLRRAGRVDRSFPWWALLQPLYFVPRAVKLRTREAIAMAVTAPIVALFGAGLMEGIKTLSGS